MIVVACLSQRLRLRLLEVLGLEDPRFEPGFDPETPDIDALDDVQSFSYPIADSAELAGVVPGVGKHLCSARRAPA